MKHIFFDLDRTLWDFERNSEETLTELFQKYEINTLGIAEPKVFIDRYKIINEACWAEYRIGNITKEALRGVRFEKTFQFFGIKAPEIALALGEDYVKYGPHKTNLFPGTFEVLDYLKGKYALHIITNGFEEVQEIKLTKSKLAPYFDQIITSEGAGVKKPDPQIFNYALTRAKAEADESMMIGDHLEVDVIGAQDIGMTGVYFNPDKEQFTAHVDHEINELLALKKLL